MKEKDRMTWLVLLFLLSVCIIGTLTFFSYWIAFAHDEGTSYEPLGLIGYYAFYIFRFPTHNLIWLKPEWIGRLFVPGLVVNVLFYSLIVAFTATRFVIKERKE